MVSINSTSEEVRSRGKALFFGWAWWFPLIQLPRKSEVLNKFNSLSEAEKFPLIQLPRKSEAELLDYKEMFACEFPLIQLPRKSEALRV